MRPPSDQALAQLERRARAHKRAVVYHRRELRGCMEELARLRAQCAAAGIGLSYQLTGEEDTHGQGTAQPQHR